MYVELKSLYFDGTSMDRIFWSLSNRLPSLPTDRLKTEDQTLSMLWPSIAWPSSGDVRESRLR
jgi:hypothetical protein